MEKSGGESEAHPLELEIEAALIQRKVALDEVLRMCAKLTEALQATSEEERKRAITRLLNRGKRLRQQGVSLGGMVFTIAATCLEDLCS
jgi:hypothetical protein